MNYNWFKANDYDVGGSSWMGYYRFYRLGCEILERPAMSWLKFQFAYSSYRRQFSKIVIVDYKKYDAYLDQDLLDTIPWKILRRWPDMRALVRAIVIGRDMAGPDGQSGTLGVREPRRPVSPNLTASATRAIPAQRESSS